MNARLSIRTKLEQTGAGLSLKIPENSDSFVTSVKGDSRKLIDLGLWPISQSRFDGWLHQFCGREEKFFAASLLNQLTLRTSRQFESGLGALFRGAVSSEIFPDLDDLALVEKLAGRADPRVRLVPVICEVDPPTKSGPLVLRRLQRILKINPKWMVWPWQAGALIDQGKVDHVVFVDDFLGSGSQFEKFARQWGFSDQKAGAEFIYAPVASHVSGLKYLEDKLEFVKVVTTERLSTVDEFFTEDVWQRLGQGCIASDDAKDWYLSFARSKGVEPRSTGSLGFGNLALTFGFSHSTPNSCIPLLWYESSQWQPLLER